jgi:hypothetical protein
MSAVWDNLKNDLIDSFHICSIYSSEMFEFVGHKHPDMTAVDLIQNADFQYAHYLAKSYAIQVMTVQFIDHVIKDGLLDDLDIVQASNAHDTDEVGYTHPYEQLDTSAYFNFKDYATDYFLNLESLHDSIVHRDTKQPVFQGYTNSFRTVVNLIDFAYANVDDEYLEVYEQIAALQTAHNLRTGLHHENHQSNIITLTSALETMKAFFEDNEFARVKPILTVSDDPFFQETMNWAADVYKDPSQNIPIVISSSKDFPDFNLN